ncbi:MAG: PEGA domain-containing protein [Myxococcota bacterium]
MIKYLPFVVAVGAVFFTLDAAAQEGTGQLVITSDPQGAEIRVDGEAHGNSPVRVGGLLPGTHLIEARFPSGDVITRTASVEAGSSIVVGIERSSASPALALAAPPTRSAAPQAEGAGSTIALELASEPAGLRLNFHAGTSLHGLGRVNLTVNSWTPVCSAPCETRVERGHYRAAVSDLDGDYYPVVGGLDLTEPRRLRLAIDYRRGLRAFSWILAIVGWATAISSSAFIVSDDNLVPFFATLGTGMVVGTVGQIMVGRIRPRGVVEF